MIRINLLKPEKKDFKETPAIPTPKIRKARKFPFSYLIFLLLIAVVVALYLMQRSDINEERDLLLAAQQEKESLNYVTEKLEQLEQQKVTLQRKIDLINFLKAQQPIPVRIMDELSELIPDWVWLTEIKYEDQTLEITGRALSNNLIADYIFDLENSPYITGVNLISSTQKSEGNSQYLEFTLTAQYALPRDYSPPEESAKEETK